jgi:hypothetical protein
MATWQLDATADIGARTPKALAKWAGRAAVAKGRLALADRKLRALEEETRDVRARGLNAWSEAAFQLMEQQLPGEVAVLPALAELSMAVELLDMAERVLRILELLPRSAEAAKPTFGNHKPGGSNVQSHRG